MMPRSIFYDTHITANSVAHVLPWRQNARARAISTSQILANFEFSPTLAVHNFTNVYSHVPKTKTRPTPNNFLPLCEISSDLLQKCDLQVTRKKGQKRASKRLIPL